MSKFKNLILFCLISSFFNANIAIAQQNNPTVRDAVIHQPPSLIRVDVQSERVPAGTIFELRMETPINSINSDKGDVFRATLVEDINVGSNVILPAGTLLRGRINYVKPNSYLSRSGELSLSFDHVVTPFGKQVPITANVTKARYLTTDGILSAGGGYAKALDRNIDQSTDIIADTTEYSVNKGMSLWNGWPVAITAPVGAFVGVTAGSGYFLVKSTIDVFRKGDNVKVNPGEVLEVTLIESIDIPTN